MSKGEDRVEQILIKSNFHYIKEYSFSDLKYKGNLLRYDFAVFNEDGTIFCLIEFDGLQHFQRVEFFASRREFLHMQENDRRKNQYCLVHNIPLYRVPFYDLEILLEINNIINTKYKVTSVYHNDYLSRQFDKKD